MRMFILFTLIFTNSLYSAAYIYPDDLVTCMEKAELEEVRSQSFETHHHPLAKLLHVVNEKLVFLPFWTFLHAQAYFEQPCPGENKEMASWKKGIRKTAAFLVCWNTAIPAFHSFLWGMALRAVEHPFRPFLCYLHTPTQIKKTISLTKERPLHVATFNMSLTPSSVNIKMDLRDPKKRAHELALAIINDPTPPEVMIIEEGWNEEALKILTTQLSSLYPHILHSVAPQIVGMSSGVALFSRYEIEKITFSRFSKIPFPHNLPSRGILSVHFETEQGPLSISGGIHTHSMLGEKSARARLLQLKQLSEHIAHEKSVNPLLMQVVMGDLNTSRIGMYGQDNLLQPEGRVWNSLQQTFRDLFLKDHDTTGNRTSGTPLFLAQDNARMNTTLPEPLATWYDGPFLSHTTWGTSRWFSSQPSDRARLDYILLPHDCPLDGHAEIRRIIMPPTAHSPSSDHLPLHALLWRK